MEIADAGDHVDHLFANNVGSFPTSSATQEGSIINIETVFL
jgi:hypothetical protein